VFRPGIEQAQEAVQHSGGIADFIGRVLLAMAPLAIGALWWMDVIRPGSFARRGVRDVKAWPAWLWGVCAAMMLFSQAAGMGLGARAMGLRDAPPAGSPERRELTLEQRAGAGVGAALASGGAGLALFFMLRARTPGTPESTGLDVTPSARAITTGLIGIGWRTRWCRPRAWWRST
jgi:hypothetical protein